MTPPRRSPADDALAEAFSALGSPNRIALLRQLRIPRILAEIHLPPEVPDDAGGSDRPIARAAVRGHVRKLLDAEMVVAQNVSRPFGAAIAYLVNHRRLFALAEGLREMASLRPLLDDGARATIELGAEEPDDVPPPRLVIVKGVDEGRGFSVRPRDPAREQSWLIGRRAGVDIRLDYDPYVSQENARVLWSGDGYRLEPVSSARNPTRINFRPLPSPGAQLRHGDIVGAGRSMLVFQDA